MDSELSLLLIFEIYRVIYIKRLKVHEFGGNTNFINVIFKNHLTYKYILASKLIDLSEIQMFASKLYRKVQEK